MTGRPSARPGARRYARLRKRLGPTVGRRARLRWVHLVLGGALLMPFHLVTTTIVASLGVVDPDTFGGAIAMQVIALGFDLPAVALVGLVPLVRGLEGSAVRALADPPGEVLTTPARSWPARRRASVWFTAHTVVGGIVAGLSLALPPAGVLLVLMAFLPDLGAQLDWMEFARGRPAAGVPAGAALCVLPFLATAAGGAWLARVAPVLLGPTPADRLALAEQRAEHFAERARIARELHDSVGHALSAVTLQAAAAGRLLDTDPAFAAEALGAIEETARDAVAELDHVLGLLREEDNAAKAPAPTLADLPGLVARTRAAGADIELDLGERGFDAARVPGTVSREAYRVVQEGLTNALRHAADAPVTLRVAVVDTGHGAELAIVITNPLPRAAKPPRARGGRGLRGAAERIAVLRGRFSAGPRGDTWHLATHLPLGEQP